MATETQQLDSLSSGSLSQGNTMRRYWDAGASEDWAMHPEDDSDPRRSAIGQSRACVSVFVCLFVCLFVCVRAVVCTYEYVLLCVCVLCGIGQ